jgi:AcrR family transcriptional regulator
MRLPFFLDPNDAPSKQAILQAALSLFVTDGIRESTLRTIAAKAGFSNPVLFKFFESKEALALHLFERCYARLVADIARALSTDGTFRVRLRALLVALVALFEESPEALLFVTEELRRFWPHIAPEMKRRTANGLVRAFFEDGVKHGDVARDIAVPMLVVGFWGSLSQFCRMMYFGELGGRAHDHIGALEALTSKMLGA